jgi:hypothetical protein
MRVPRVMGGGREAKIWLAPEVSIARSYGFNAKELATILEVVTGRRELILKRWHEYFGNGGSI